MTILHKNLKILNNFTPFKLVFYSYLFLELFIVMPYLAIIHFFNIDTGGIDKFDSLDIYAKYLISIIIGPIFETLIFQTLIILIIKKINSNWNTIAIIVSAILFGLNHSYSLAYIIYTIFVGIIFAYIYILSQEKKFNAFLIVFSIHALHNLTMALL